MAQTFRNPRPLILVSPNTTQLTSFGKAHAHSRHGTFHLLVLVA